MKHASVVLALLLGGCVTARTTVTYSDQEQTASPTLQDAAINASLGTLLTTATREVRLVPTIGASFSGSLISAGAARDAVRGFQLRVLQGFAGPQYAGLRPELEDMLMSENWTRRLPVEEVPLVGPAIATRSVDQAFEEILGFVRNLTQRPDKRVSFEVVSVPKQANFRICPQYLAEQCYALMTDGTVARLLRGYYTYTLELTGYKPVEVNLDLVPFAKTKLRCVLRSNDDPRAAGPCTPE
jgi:hypothetical protein